MKSSMVEQGFSAAGGGQAAGKNEECADAGYLQVPHWPQDSIYTVLCRFALVNGLSDPVIQQLFKTKRRLSRAVDFAVGLETMTVMDVNAALALLTISHKSLEAMFLRAVPIGQSNVISPYLRYCAICMGAQRHFVFFQREQLRLCPFHGVVLRSRCQACGLHLDYAWGAQLFAHPFCCPGCATPLVGTQVKRSFYDLLTPHRESLLEHYSIHGNPAMTRARIELSSCPGYLLTHPQRALAGWHGLEKLPLQERRRSDMNWVLADGYVQIRTRLCARQERHWSGEPQDRDLIACLKAILRHLRKVWRIRGSMSFALGGLRCAASVRSSTNWRWRVYQEFCGYCARASLLLQPDEAAAQPQAARCWPTELLEALGIVDWPRPARAWFILHRFAEHALDSLSRCAETATWPSDVDEDFVVEYVRNVARPLWPVEFISEEGCTGYRLLRHRRFLEELIYPSVTGMEE